MIDIILIREAKQGSEEALCIVYEKYIGLIIYKAKKYSSHATIEDLIQEGRIGLYKAVKYYNEKKGASFSTFASLCIERQILTAFKFLTSPQTKFHTDSIMCPPKKNYDSSVEHLSISKYGNPESELLYKENMEYLKKRLNAHLSAIEKKAIKYASLGFTYSEIALLTNMNPKTIDNAIQRGKSKVKLYIKY